MKSCKTVFIVTTLALGLFLTAPELGADSIGTVVVQNGDPSAGPAGHPPSAKEPSGLPPTEVLKSVPVTDKDAAHLVPAMAITLRYLFNIYLVFFDFHARAAAIP